MIIIGNIKIYSLIIIIKYLNLIPRQRKYMGNTAAHLASTNYPYLLDGVNGAFKVGGGWVWLFGIGLCLQGHGNFLF